MELQFIVLSLCVTLAASIDLGPYIRIAQCRSQCVRQYSVDGTCVKLSNSGNYVCQECWRHCENLEYQWEIYKDLCEYDAVSSNCPSCKTICDYRKTRVIEEYLPSTLPAPEKPPVSMRKFDVAILFRRINNEWKESGYYLGIFDVNLRPDMWLIVVSGDGVKHYSHELWTPTLESLKPGPLYEANISWRNVQAQIRRNFNLNQKMVNEKVRQFQLEKYGHQVERIGAISDAVFTKFFFKSIRDGDLVEDPRQPSTSIHFYDLDDIVDKKESWVVAWEPEAGGLMGNQEADSSSAQITLLPGTKYHVRVASKDGPGSLPIEIDTSSEFVQVHRIKKNFENIYEWRIIAASISIVTFIIVFIIVKLLTKSKKVYECEEEVV